MPKKDNTMLIVGGAGGGVVLLVIIILAASGRGGGGGYTGGGGEGASFDPLARAKDLDKQAADYQSGSGESKMQGRRLAYDAFQEYRSALSSPSLSAEQRDYAQSRVNSMASWASTEESARSAVPAYAAKVDDTSVDSGKAVYDEGFAMLSKYGSTSCELQLREAVDKAGRMAGSAASEDWGGRFHGKRSKARSLAEQGDTAKAIKLLEDFLAEGPPPEVAQKCQSEIESLKSGGR